MSQMQNFVQEKKNINSESIQSENIYSQDNLFFSELAKNEEWSFLQYEELTITNLSFLFIRSLLSKELTDTKLKIKDLNQSIKARIAKWGISDFYNQFMDSETVLGLSNDKVNPSFLKERFFEEKSFHLDQEERKFSILTGGGILKEKKTNANEMVEKLFKEFSLTEKTGHFFLRTKLNSYLYLLNPENKNKTFYIQQKNSFSSDFLFYHIKINK